LTHQTSYSDHFLLEGLSGLQLGLHDD